MVSEIGGSLKVDSGTTPILDLCIGRPLPFQFGDTKVNFDTNLYYLTLFLIIFIKSLIKFFVDVVPIGKKSKDNL